MIVQLIQQGALDIPNGSSTLHFNNRELKAIDLNIKQWHSNKSNCDNIYKNNLINIES